MAQAQAQLWSAETLQQKKGEREILASGTYGHSPGYTSTQERPSAKKKKSSALEGESVSRLAEEEENKSLF